MLNNYEYTRILVCVSTRFCRRFLRRGASAVPRKRFEQKVMDVEYPHQHAAEDVDSGIIRKQHQRAGDHRRFFNTCPGSVIAHPVVFGRSMDMMGACREPAMQGPSNVHATPDLRFEGR